jgi:hypothetical protein
MRAHTWRSGRWKKIRMYSMDSSVKIATGTESIM